MFNLKETAFSYILELNVRALDAARVNKFIELTDTLNMVAKEQIEIDFSEVSFVDSSGIGALLGLRKRLIGEQRKLVLRSCKPPFLNLLEMLAVKDFFIIK